MTILDLRTKEARVHKQRLIGEAIELRELGLTYRDIAGALGVDPGWVANQVAFNAPASLSGADKYVLADRRLAVRQGTPAKDVTVFRKRRQLGRWMQYREKRWREWQEQRARPISMDQNLKSQSGLSDVLTVGATVASRDVSADPVAVVEMAELRQLLGDLDVADLDRMDELTLEHLRERLRVAGYGKRPVMQDERDRLLLKRRVAGHSGRSVVMPSAKEREREREHSVAAEKWEQWWNDRG